MLVILPDPGLGLTLRFTRFDSSIGRGPFVCSIGVGQVIKGTLGLVSQAYLGPGN
jgi:hypothetical protein